MKRHHVWILRAGSFIVTMLTFLFVGWVFGIGIGRGVQQGWLLMSSMMMAGLAAIFPWEDFL